MRTNTIEVTKELINGRHNAGGPLLEVAGFQVASKRLIMEGRMLTIARLKGEWSDDMGNPEAVIDGLMKYSAKPDILTFWQRLPDVVPLYSYHTEYEALSAVPITSFDQWWKHQIGSDTRKKAKRAENRGVRIGVVSLDADFVRGVMGVFNETPVRRGKPFWHYGKDFRAVEELLALDLATSKFIAAHFDGELVGFVKLNYFEQRFVNPGLFLTKLRYRREKYLDNALMAKSIELCAQDSIPYLSYTSWRQGDHATFLGRNGFVKTLVPRYWIPLTTKGAIAVRLGLHRELRTRIPESAQDAYRAIRGQVNQLRYRNIRNDPD